MDNTDFLIIKGKSRSSVSPQSVAGKRYLERTFSGLHNAILIIDSEFVEEIVKKLEDEGYNVIVR